MEHHTISDNQRRRIVHALERDDVSDLSPIEQLSSPQELHQFMMHYNWDDGDDAVIAVLDHPQCDFGTALLIYWLSGPIVCEATRDHVIEKRPWSSQLYGRIETLERELIESDYSATEFSVDPHNLMNDGFDWTQRSGENAFKRDPPAELCVPSPGRPMRQDDLDYELTPEEVVERERLDAANLAEYQRSQKEYKEWSDTTIKRMNDAPIDSDLESLEKAAKRDPAFKPNLEAYKRKYGISDSTD